VFLVEKEKLFFKDECKEKVRRRREEKKICGWK
jgi:hypothetical protein